MQTPLLVVLPYCVNDSQSALRLLDWIAEIKGPFEHPACLLAADSAVPHQDKLAIQERAKRIFTFTETMIVNAPAPMNGNYHVPSSVMFEQAARQVDQCFRWNWLWLEPDCVPLKLGWLTALTDAYNAQPKRFMGALIETTQPNVPKTHLAGVAIYPNCAHSDLKTFCDGNKGAFDMQMAAYVVPRAVNTPLLFHRFGQLNDPPRFHEVLPADATPNDGTLASIPKEAVLFHRTKTSGLIDLLRKQLQSNPPTHETFEAAALTEIQGPRTVDQVLQEFQKEASTVVAIPPKKRMGRPPKQPVLTTQETT